MALPIPRIPKSVAREILRALAGGATINYSQIVAKWLKLGLSPRQQKLNRLWAHYRGLQYDTLKYEWDGTERMDALDLESVTSTTYIPNGFKTVADVPLKMRKPSAPYRLPAAIVNRFTAMLFGDTTKPHIACEGDPELEDWIEGALAVSKAWMFVRRARNFGGGQGTSVVMANFVDGKPGVEVFDPRWMIPEWDDKATHTLLTCERRYMYPEDVWSQDLGKYVRIWFWYRRIIDAYTDTEYMPEPVEHDEEPIWRIKKQVVHPFGRCPVIWTHNLHVDDSEDGDPDYALALESFAEMDKLLAQGFRGVISNCDPTPVVKTDRPFSELQKGSSHALVIGPQDDFKYAELQSTGPDAAFKAADILRAHILEVCQCILDHPEAAVQKTATEVERVYMNMLTRIADLRDQYGNNQIIPLVRLWVDGATAIAAQGITTDEAGNSFKSVVRLPDKLTRDDKGVVIRKARVLPPNSDLAELALKWPQHFAPSLMDITSAVTAATAALEGGIVDQEAASRLVAPMFAVGDVDAMIRRIESAQLEAEAKAQAAVHAEIAAKGAAKSQNTPA